MADRRFRQALHLKDLDVVAKIDRRIGRPWRLIEILSALNGRSAAVERGPR
jgi:hypothetical protein